MGVEVDGSFSETDDAEPGLVGRLPFEALVASDAPARGAGPADAVPADAGDVESQAADCRVAPIRSFRRPFLSTRVEGMAERLRVACVRAESRRGREASCSSRSAAEP